jgi:hypothetical protein
VPDLVEANNESPALTSNSRCRINVLQKESVSGSENRIKNQTIRIADSILSDFGLWDVDCLPNN